MPDTFQIYQSDLTGPELDEALRNIGKVQQSVADAAKSAATAEQYGTIVQKNQDAIQDIADNLTAIQQAAQNAQDAQNAAEQAANKASEAASSAAAADASAKEAALAAERASTMAVAYTIYVPTTGWQAGSLEWAGATYTRKCTVTAQDATANPTQVTMAYEGGDYDAYCQVALLDTQDGSVVLWAQADPAATCQIKVVEVRPGEQSDQ